MYIHYMLSEKCLAFLLLCHVDKTRSCMFSGSKSLLSIFIVVLRASHLPCNVCYDLLEMYFQRAVLEIILIRAGFCHECRPVQETIRMWYRYT